VTKFTSLDLIPYFNANRDPAGWHPQLAQLLPTLPCGPKTFWGVPFELGPSESNCWLILERDQQAATIPLSGQASFILIAHFCDESHDPYAQTASNVREVGFCTRPGEILAHYDLVYANKIEHSQPIRRRFEINEALTVWGQDAFAARPHVQDEPRDWRGPYPPMLWGGYQTGMAPFSEGRVLYWLYALANPHPEAELTALRLRPTGAGRLAVAGVTLYHGRTNPLRHRRLESVRVTLAKPIRPREAKVDIDLGIIARAYAVPSFNPDRWLESEPKGWGEETPISPLGWWDRLPPEEPTTQLLLDVTAGPDATLQVAGHRIELAQLSQNSCVESADREVRVQVLTPEKTWVHATVREAGSGRPTPVRIHFRSPDGRYFPPHGHRKEVNDNWFEDYGGDLKLGSTQYAYVDGRFQIELPVGEVYVEIAKGFEYEPLRQRVIVAPGQQELELQIRRKYDWRSRGWVTADTHVHFLSPQTAWLEAKAEGVNLVNLLATQWGELYSNVADITGDVSGVSRDDTLIWVGTENRQHVLGHISLLGGKGEPTLPLCAGGPDESYLGDPAWMSLADWADRCREKEGLVVLPHFPNPYCEAVADIILGKIDAAEIRYFTPAMDSNNVREWYRYLNCGYRLTAVGGTDKMWAGMPVGGVRTYTYLGDADFTFANWADAVRAGRTFTTSGPLISLSVEGFAPGDEIQLPTGGGTLEAEASVHSVQPFHELQLVMNGQVIARETADQGTFQGRIQTKIQVRGSAWVAARCISRHKVWHGWPVNIAAHTSPIYVTCNGDELFAPSEATYLLTLIDGGLTWLDTLSIPASPERGARLRAVFEAARRELIQRFGMHNHPPERSDGKD
jgi:hypothetical protein